MNIKGNHLRSLALLGILLASMFGKVAAQSASAYVVYSTGGLYLAHVWNESTSTWELTGAASFSPNCIWFSNNVHNYYFEDEHNPGTRQYLTALRSANAPVSLTPNPADLGVEDGNYYFYDWDWGLARGTQTALPCEPQDQSEDGTHCWNVYWIVYNGGWQMSADHSYEPVANYAVFRKVRINNHDVEVSSPTGGLGNLTLTSSEMEYGDFQNLSIAISDYAYRAVPAYTTYSIGELENCGSNWVSRSCDTNWQVHNYYNDQDNLSTIPTSQQSATNPASTATFLWTLSGDGASYLSIDNPSSRTPRLTYSNHNKTGDKTATLTLTVTYADGSTQTRTATITVKTECGHPVQASAPHVTYEGVTVSWVRTSTSYTVSWSADDWSTSASANVGDVTSYTITNLAVETDYQYKVEAVCTPADASAATVYSFTTKEQAGLLVYGAIFGGGRMANVTGKTSVVVINCDSVSAVYGGNDIAGAVQGNDGSNITLGVNSGDSYDSYGVTSETVQVKVGSVYGGGNGYYTYDSYAPGVEIGTTRLTTGNFSSSVTNVGGGDSYTSSGTIPTIKKTAITVRNNYVTVDSLFGGAKNAFVTNTAGDNTHVTIDGGTIFSVFGGNNYGGTLGEGSSQHIDLNGTTTNYTAQSLQNTYTTGFGRDFGIRYVFGGGNKVQGRNITLNVMGGQADTVFGGGNSADVGSVNVTVNCSLGTSSNGASDSSLWGNTITKAYYDYRNGAFIYDRNYLWNGTGLYNVRALFGGNNAADMSNVPTLTLTSGHVGTVYGGGNAGRMLDDETDNGSGGALSINGNAVKYGTHVVMASDDMKVDFLYGGCQKSDVLYSTWVEINGGHVGTVYGGCNIAGDVGSTRTNMGDYSAGSLEYQSVQGGTYVVASGGTVHGNLFAGSNGFYHCNNGLQYVSGINYDDAEERYIGLRIPTHNETTVMVHPGVTIYGNVYAGGNLAYVGFRADYSGNAAYPKTVGFATVKMDGGTVAGSVYGGGNMAEIYGINDVEVSGGTIGGALYGGNDRAGKVGEEANRTRSYTLASDGETSIELYKTYVKVYGTPRISTVFGGGNGDYDYTENSDVPICGDPNNAKPIQGSTFVDVNIEAGDTTGYDLAMKNGTAYSGGGFINTVYGGGDGVTVENSIAVFLNLNGTSDPDVDNIGIIFGGNNKGDLTLLPEVMLYKGNVNTIYGGCNQGAMTGSHTVYNSDLTESYTNVSSSVHLLGTYLNHPVTAKVSTAVYGGCRLNGVSNNSLVLVEGGSHPTAALYGGSDISGTITGTAQVVMTGGTVGMVYGGGNGNYTYDNVNYTIYSGETLVATGDYSAPQITDGLVQLDGGTVGDAGSAATANVVFGGGYGQLTRTTGSTTVNIGPATGVAGPYIYGAVYGGSALGEVNGTVVSVLNGHVYGSVYGGGLGDTTYFGVGHTNIAAKVNGNAVVNIGNSTQASNGVYIDGYVFGGNNNNGSPAGTVDVNIYRTAHTEGLNGNSVPSEELTVDDMFDRWYQETAPDDSGSFNGYYALKGVYGGGNLAHKASTAANTVHVYYCDNSIKYVYGGAKAADIAGNTTVIIDGGHIYQVFGGGDGSVPGTAANIGGDATTTIHGGYMHYVFGGSNTSGEIAGTKYVNVETESTPGSCHPPIIFNFFAGGNRASSTGDQEITITDCNAKFGNFYGGANQASITGDVTTNIYGGTYRQIFGGSRNADITGDVTVNFYGGTVGNIFGGNNYGGQISDHIVVNVEKNTTYCPSFSVDNVYGGGRNAAYGTAENARGNYPEVNIKHTGDSRINYDVYGGGLGSTAHVYGNPHVTIGDDNAEHTVTVGRYVFGGGSAAPVTGNTYVKLMNNVEVVGNVYGGGNAAQVTGNTQVVIGDTCE